MHYFGELFGISRMTDEMMQPRNGPFKDRKFNHIHLVIYYRVPIR